MVNPMIIHGVKKTTKIMKVLGEDAIGWKYVVCNLSEVIYIRAFSQPPPMMVGLTIIASSPTTYHLASASSDAFRAAIFVSASASFLRSASTTAAGAFDTKRSLPSFLFTDSLKPS